MVTSGLRVGASALATRGLGVEDFREVGEIIATALTPAFDDERAALAERVAAIAGRHPLYEELAAQSEGAVAEDAPAEPVTAHS
jgi:glycine hydroxymethyltransferase